MSDTFEKRIDEIAYDLETGWRPFRCRSADGLTLAGRLYGTPDSNKLPLLCLPGLTRNSKDFHVLARALSGERFGHRQVLALEFRGRGDSDRDSDWSRYDPAVELDDVCVALRHSGIDRYAILGTSRGGLVGLLLALTEIDNIAALILNDVGPAIETKGLARIRNYVSAAVCPDDWPAAVQAVKAVNGRYFPHFTDDDWLRFAMQIYRQVDGQPAIDFDPAIAHTLEKLDLEQPLPALWDVFDGLLTLPVMVIRGENSDILSEDTVDKMAACHPEFQTVTVADQGHTPVLWDDDIIQRIAQFLEAADARASSAEDAARHTG